MSGHAPRTRRRARAPGRSGACRPGPGTRHVQAGRRCTTRDRPGSVPRTRCRALAAHGRDPPGPRPRQAPPGQPRPASRARRHRAGRALLASTTRSVQGLTRTRQGQARTRPTAPRGRRCPGIQGNPGIRGRTSPGRPSPTPDRHTAGRDRRTTGRRPGGRRERDAAGSQRDTSPRRSGRPPGCQVSRALCRLARARAVQASTRRGSRGPASTVLAGPVPGSGPGQSRVPTVRDSRGRPASPATGKESLGRGSGYGQGQFPAGPPGPGQFGQGYGPGRPRPVRSRSVRPGPGAHGRAVRPGPRSDAVCRGPVQQHQPVRRRTAWRHADARAVRPAPAEHRILAGRGAAAGTWLGS